MIELTRGYNGDQYISHFQCRQYLFNLVYTHRHKSDTLQLFEKAINTIENQYNRKVHLKLSRKRNHNMHICMSMDVEHILWIITYQRRKSLNHELILDILLDMILQISIESRYQLIKKLFVHEMLQWTTTFYII